MRPQSFFVCKDNQNNHYLALLMSLDNLGYYVIMPSDEEIHKMLSGQVPMRDLFVNAEWYWLVYCKDEPKDDSVWYISGKNMNKFVLPDIDEFYEANSDEHREYIQDFEKEFLA